MPEISEHDSGAVIKAGSKSFAGAARLFKNSTRDDVYQLYAWCRHCDDAIDGQIMGFGNEYLSAEDQRGRLAKIVAETRRAVDGLPVDDPAFRGLQRVVQRHAIPAIYPLDLIEGFAMDVRGHRYVELEDTLLYCYHVAGVVGIMMAYVMGVRDKTVLQRAADLGIGFQLTNIARDVMDDADNNRVYLPETWLAEAGVPVAAVDEPQFREGVFVVVKRLLAEADRFYESAREGIRELPLDCAWAISAADGIYHSIGDLVIARGARAWDERAFTPRYRKLYWLMRGGISALASVGLQKGRPMAPRQADLWIKPELA